MEISMEEIAWMELPSYYIALAQWCAFTLILYLATKETKWGWKKWLQSGLELLVMEAVLIILGWPLHLPRLIILLAGWLMMLLFGMLALRGKILASISISFYAFVLAEAVSAVFWQVSTYPIFFGYIQRWLPYAIMVLVYALLFTASYFALRQIINENMLKELKNRDAIFAFLVSLVLYLVGNIGFFIPESPIINTTSWGIYQMRTMISIIGALLIFAYLIGMAEASREKENQLMRSVIKEQYNQYLVNQDSMEFIRMKYHDLKHQIDGLKGAKGHEERVEWIEALEREVEMNELFVPTGHAILDTILASKQVKARKENIRLTCVANGKLLRFITPGDVCTLFGNALDNAMEAVKDIQDEERRLIHLTVTEEKSFLLIVVSNVCERKIELGSNGLPKTTKAEEGHGLGMRSIQYTAAKYDGTMTAEVQDGWFKLRILIPIQDKVLSE